jgi:hypothetical protein
MKSKRERLHGNVLGKFWVLDILGRGKLHERAREIDGFRIWLFI